jgi:hypothetical protein
MTEVIDITRSWEKHRQKDITNTEPFEPGWLGNPHPDIGECPYCHEKHSTEEAVKLFREDFNRRYHSDSEFKKAVDSLRGKQLRCACDNRDNNKPCHGDIIRDKISKSVFDY